MLFAKVYMFQSMSISQRTIILLIVSAVTLLSILSTHVRAYIPTVHPHDLAIVASKPSMTKPLTKDVPIAKPSTIHPSKHSTVAKISRTKWGSDHDHPEEYWFDDRIHTLGNKGFGGAVHAALAALSTKIIDMSAYHGVDVRLKLARELSDLVGTQKARVLDLCCGVGTSTRALQHAFPEATTVIGIDTSKEMVAMANFLTNHLQSFSPIHDNMSAMYKTLKKKGYAIKRASTHKAIKFLQANAESTSLPDKSFDLVTVMWAFHEAPRNGRAKILKEARRLLAPGGVLAVVDISSDYVPSKAMLQGEPYVKEYQKNIHSQLKQFQGFKAPQYRSIVENHLGMWTLTRLATIA